MTTQRILPFIVLLLATACGSSQDTPQQHDALTLSEATVATQRAVPESSIPAPIHEHSFEGLSNPDSMLDDVMPAAASLAQVLPEPIEEIETEPVPVSTYKLRHGETLHYFAKWSGLPVEEIAELSGLDLGGDYAVGTEVAIPSDSVDIAALEVARTTHWTRRIEGYLASRGGTLGSDFHTVATGETAWSIATDSNGIPMWLLASYNPEASLDNLHPGEKLMVPVLADIVVDAAEDTEPEFKSEPVAP